MKTLAVLVDVPENAADIAELLDRQRPQVLQRILTTLTLEEGKNALNTAIYKMNRKEQQELHGDR